MIDPIKQVKKYIRDLLNVDPNNIRQGRDDYTNDNFDNNLIVVDSIGQRQLLSQGQFFDDVNEIMTYSQHYTIPITIDFYGDSAEDNAHRFIMLQRSQDAYEISLQHGVTINVTGGITDVKLLTGSQHKARLQVELNAQYSDKIEVDTLRIDEPNLELVLTDTGAEYNG